MIEFLNWYVSSWVNFLAFTFLYIITWGMVVGFANALRGGPTIRRKREQ